MPEFPHIVYVDSGSTDGSVDLIRAAKPRVFVQMLPHEYRPGRVLNQGMELAADERVIFLNADATPQGTGWLRPLVQGLDDVRTAAVFGKQIPRPDCRAVFAADYERCYGPNRESAQWDHFFSMVSSGLRKSIWTQRGFLEAMQYSEDDEYTRWAKAQGFRIVYRGDSVVMHSHNYTARQSYKRAFGEAWALAAVSAAPAPGLTDRTRLLGGVVKDALRDLRFCHANHRLGEWPHALRIRWEQRWGRRAGFRAGWSMHGASLVAAPVAAALPLARSATAPAFLPAAAAP